MEADLGFVVKVFPGQGDVGQALTHVSGPGLLKNRLDVGAQQPVECIEQFEERDAPSARHVEDTPGHVLGVGGQ